MAYSTGIEQNNIEIVKNLEGKLSIEEIAEVTKLSINDEYLLKIKTFSKIFDTIVLESSDRMTLYLVSNNMVLENIVYETDETVEEKRVNRPLSIEGEKAAVKLVKKIDANVIYSSDYASALATAKYYASYKNLPIMINSFLSDSKIGKLGNRNIKMLRFMQERDFNFKFNGGESLNETSNRMNIAIDRIIKNNINKKVVIFTHKRAILGYLLKYLETGFNLDDRLILTFDEKVIVDDIEKDIDIIKIELEKNKVVDVDVIE